MLVGITGHQARHGIDWECVKRSIRTELARLHNITKGLSSLAAGSDQVFAEAALSLDIPVLAVIPIDGYEKFMKGEGLANYRRVLRGCDVTRVSHKGNAQRAFLEAGKFIVEKSSLVFAVWDGKDAVGQGGTGDVVHFAQQSAKRILHINPIIQHVDYL